VDIQSDEDPIAMENEEVCMPSAFFVKEDEPKVSHDFRCLPICICGDKARE
jgi:hypothetical protein